MRVLTGEGELFGGADAYVYLAKFIGWAWPLRMIGKSAWGMQGFRRFYKGIARNRHCINGACLVRRQSPLWTWMPLIFLPLLAILGGKNLPPWLFMGVLVLAIFMGCKWLTLPDGMHAVKKIARWRMFAYLFLWPGMDARAFLDAEQRPENPGPGEWAFAFGKTLLGAFLIWGMARMAFPADALVQGWVGMVGLIFIAHFGVFHLLALAWQKAGVMARAMK